MSDYQPIPCALHSEYELWIMHRRQLQVRWQDEKGEPHGGKLMPRDVYTRAGEEFLVLESDSGERLDVRLDRIIEARPTG